MTLLRRSSAMRLALAASMIFITCPLSAAHGQADQTRTSEAVQIARSLFRALDVKFEAGQSVIHPASLASLDAVADVLIRFPDLRLQIAGHTDASGSAEANMKLSERRAEAVKTYLIARHGIDAGRLETIGFGESIPIASNSTSVGRALNRRVEFRVLRTTPAQEEQRTPAASDTVRALDRDSLRAALERQVEEAVRSALGEPDPEEEDRVAELEERLQARLDSIAARLAEEPDAVSEAEVAAPPPTERPLALLPFTGIYLRADVPVLLGLRADVPTSLLGGARFQPEAAFGFKPDGHARIVNANLVFPIRVPAQAGLTPFLGTGLGFHNLDGIESVLNLLVGTEYRLEFGVVFVEVMTQDVFDFNRLIMGFRQNF